MTRIRGRSSLGLFWSLLITWGRHHQLQGLVQHAGKKNALPEEWALGNLASAVDSFWLEGGIINLFMTSEMSSSVLWFWRIVLRLRSHESRETGLWLPKPSASWKRHFPCYISHSSGVRFGARTKGLDESFSLQVTVLPEELWTNCIKATAEGLK